MKLNRVVSSRPSRFGEKTCGETWNNASVRSTITASVAVVSIPIALRAVSTIPYRPSAIPVASQRNAYEPAVLDWTKSVVTGVPNPSTSVAVTTAGSRIR